MSGDDWEAAVTDAFRRVDDGTVRRKQLVERIGDLLVGEETQPRGRLRVVDESFEPEPFDDAPKYAGEYADIVGDDRPDRCSVGTTSGLERRSTRDSGGAAQLTTS